MCTRQHGEDGGGETSDTDCPPGALRLRGAGDARLELVLWERARRDCSVVMWRSHVKVLGDMFLSFGMQVQQLL